LLLLFIHRFEFKSASKKGASLSRQSAVYDLWANGQLYFQPVQECCCVTRASKVGMEKSRAYLIAATKESIGEYLFFSFGRIGHYRVRERYTGGGAHLLGDLVSLIMCQQVA
jgi:hypothetical protein